MTTKNCAVVGRRQWWGDGGAPVQAQVAPGGVVGDDESDFLQARPRLEFCFAGEGVVDVAEALDVDKAVDAVAGGEGIAVGGGFVGGDALLEVAGDADVEVLVRAGENVDGVGVVGHWASVERDGWGEKWTFVGWCSCRCAPS